MTKEKLKSWGSINTFNGSFFCSINQQENGLAVPNASLSDYFLNKVFTINDTDYIVSMITPVYGADDSYEPIISLKVDKWINFDAPIEE